MQHQKEYYQNLFASNKSVKFTLTNTEGNKLTPEDREPVEKPFTLEELTVSVKQLKVNKTCGNDGWPSEIMQFFLSKFSDLYFNAINYAKEQGVLHLAA